MPYPRTVTQRSAGRVDDAKAGWIPFPPARPRRKAFAGDAIPLRLSKRPDEYKDRGSTPRSMDPLVALLLLDRRDLAVADYVDGVGGKRVSPGAAIDMVSLPVFGVDVIIALIAVHIT